MNKAFSLLALLVTTTTLWAQTNGAKRVTAPQIPQHASEASAHPNLTVVTTNHVLISGTLVSQSATNLVVSSFGMNISIPKEQIKWCETNLVNAMGSPAPAAAQVVTGPVAVAPNTNASSSIIAEFNKPHTEAEMRGLLQTQEGQALVQSIASAYIGAETDSSTSAARKSYLDMVQQFESGSLGLTEIQGQAQDVLGQFGKYDKELTNDPNAEEWKEYKEILQGFISETPSTPSTPADQLR